MKNTPALRPKIEYAKTKAGAFYETKESYENRRGEPLEKPLCRCGHTFFMHDGGGLEGCDESDGKDFCGCKEYEPVTHEGSTP